MSVLKIFFNLEYHVELWCVIAKNKYETKCFEQDVISTNIRIKLLLKMAFTKKINYGYFLILIIVCKKKQKIMKRRIDVTIIIV